MFVLYEKEEACFTFILDVVCPHPASVVLVSVLLSFARKESFILVKYVVFPEIETLNSSKVLIVRISVVELQILYSCVIYQIISQAISFSFYAHYLSSSSYLSTYISGFLK